MVRQFLLLGVVLSCNAFGQSTVEHGRAVSAVLKGSTMTAASGPAVTVSKTAYVDGHEVCGVIRITNSGGQPVATAAIVDTLEVHFPRNLPAPSLPPGSTPTWYKVADVPIANPGPITPGATIFIDYCFSLCQTADYAGANSMRNVVSVTVASASGNSRTFTTRSNSFPPPALDCRACCLPDGSCTDTVPAACASAGGISQAAGTDCATTQCLQGCCGGDGTCRDETLIACEAAGGNALGLGSTCATADTTCRGACCWFKGCDDDVSTGDCRDLYVGTFLDLDTTCETQLAACPTGACCFDGNCTDAETDGYHRSQAYCEPSGVYQGDGTTCATVGPTCRGACCWFKGCDDEVSDADCRDLYVGTYLGHGTTCETQLAACPTGACCFDGDCTDVETDGYHRSQAYCEPGGVYLGDGSTCATGDCPRPCCYGDGTCAELARGACLTSGGRPLDPDLTPGTCAELDVVGGCPQGCCFDGGHCEGLVPLACSLRGGTSQGPGTNCGGVGCPRGCCHDDGTCSEEPASVCQDHGGRPQTIHDENGHHIGIDCDEVAARGGCAAPCCFPDPGSNYCNTIPPAECTSLGGFPRPVSLNCGTPDLCDAACCIGGSCQVMSVQDCTEQGGDPQNPGSDCGFGPLSPCSEIGE